MSEEKKSKGFLATLWDKVSLRPIMHKLGGRKLIAAGGGLAVIDRIVAAGGETFGMPHAIACVAVAIVAVGLAISTAWEDRAATENGGSEDA